MNVIIYIFILEIGYNNCLFYLRFATQEKYLISISNKNDLTFTKQTN